MTLQGLVVERREAGRDLLAWAFRVARLWLGKNLGRVLSRHQEQHVLRHLGRKEPDVFIRYYFADVSEVKLKIVYIMDNFKGRYAVSQNLPH